MKYRTGRALIAVAFLLTAGRLSAHHGFMAVFDPSKQVTLTGTLTKIDWTNPHVELSLDTKNNSGQIESWAIEGAPPNFFRKRGVTKNTFVKGLSQTVTVEALRARDGSLLGSLLKITFADGTFAVSIPGA